MFNLQPGDSSVLEFDDLLVASTQIEAIAERKPVGGIYDLFGRIGLTVDNQKSKSMTFGGLGFSVATIPAEEDPGMSALWRGFFVPSITSVVSQFLRKEEGKPPAEPNDQDSQIVSRLPIIDVLRLMEEKKKLLDGIDIVTVLEVPRSQMPVLTTGPSAVRGQPMPFAYDKESSVFLVPTESLDAIKRKIS